MTDGSAACPHEPSADGEQTLSLWTAQSKPVTDVLAAGETYRVKRRYVDEKYRECAWVFQTAYSFYLSTAQELVPRPAGAESGIWCYADASWASASAGQTLMRLEVPRSQAVLFDLRMWNRILNLRYLPLDRQDEREFARRLERQGVRNPSDVFSTTFYPQLKAEVLRSWRRLYGSADRCEHRFVQAGLWEIRPEWVALSVRYDGRIAAGQD